MNWAVDVVQGCISNELLRRSWNSISSFLLFFFSSFLLFSFFPFFLFSFFFKANSLKIDCLEMAFRSNC